MVFGKAFCKLYIMACRTPFLLKGYGMKNNKIIHNLLFNK